MSTIQEHYMAQMTTLDGLGIPKAARLIVWLLVFSIIIGVAALWFIPWIQTARGEGIVSALRPEQRTQAISALVPGQIAKWHVKEGDRIRAGDPIVTLIDTDAELINRLNAQIAAMEQQATANRSGLRTAEQDLTRRQNLFKEGLVSKREVEQVEIRVEDLKANVAKISAELNQVQVSLARQSTQTKKAPADGIILRLLAAGNATYVNSGDILASFIPKGVERAVVVTVSGLDAPLVYPGRKVRLQFDGWPMFQFSGWPSSAVGSFGGEVEFVEPIANTMGQFRVWVKEDLAEGGGPMSSMYA